MPSIEGEISSRIPGRAKSIKSTLTDLSTPNPNKIKIINLIARRRKGDFVPNQVQLNLGQIVNQPIQSSQFMDITGIQALKLEL